jgi:hypothetical protein
VASLATSTLDLSTGPCSALKIPVRRLDVYKLNLWALLGTWPDSPSQ